MKKQREEEPIIGPRTQEEDVAAVNGLEEVQVWLYALSAAIQPGSRIVPPETVMKKLGIDGIDAGSIVSLLVHCIQVLLSRRLTPASLLRWLAVDMSLEFERANLVVDVAASCVQLVPNGSLLDISLKLDGLASAFQSTLTPPIGD